MSKSFPILSLVRSMKPRPFTARLTPCLDDNRILKVIDREQFWGTPPTKLTPLRGLDDVDKEILGERLKVEFGVPVDMERANTVGDLIDQIHGRCGERKF